MHEIGLESTILQDVALGRKTVEGRLGKPKYLKIGVGDAIQLREDIYEHGELTRSLPSEIRIRITQVLYFESFEEMLESLNYKDVLPSALNIEDGIEIYRQFYTADNEEKYGVVALQFEVI